MEFFQKEYGIKFVDDLTGKDALSVIAENEAIKGSPDKNCASCRCGSVGDGVTMYKTDIVCVNAKSERIAEFVSKSNSCKLWEERK